MRLMVVALVYSVDRAFLDGQPARLSLPTHAPWHNVPWGLFLPLVFVCNVVMATLAWIIVSLVMRQRRKGDPNKVLTKDEARRIAVNVARLPELLRHLAKS